MDSGPDMDFEDDERNEKIKKMTIADQMYNFLFLINSMNCDLVFTGNMVTWTLILQLYLILTTEIGFHHCKGKFKPLSSHLTLAKNETEHYIMILNKININLY